MDKYSKIIQVINVLASVTLGYCVRILFEFFAVIFGIVAQAYSIEALRHGLSIGTGVACFAILQFHPRIHGWLKDVVVEIDKVVWPTKKDTLSMTVIVCVILVLSGVLLGLFDLGAGTVIRYILN